MKIIIEKVRNIPAGTNQFEIVVAITDGTEFMDEATIQFTADNVSDTASLQAAITAAILDYASGKGYSIFSSDIMWPDTTGMTAYLSGIRTEGLKMAFCSAVVADGNAVFYLTDDNTPTGNEIFCSQVIVPEGLIFLTNNAGVSFTRELVSLSADRKTLTVQVNKLALSLGVLTLSTPANGETVSVIVFGK